MNLKEFIKKYTGIKVGTTDGNFGQCTGLVHKYIEKLNLSHFWGDAKDFLNNAPNNEWIKIPNSPEGIPLPGDAIVWDGEYGHTALFVEGDVNGFTSFDQNYPLGSTPHLQYHNYDNVIGWLRIKNPIIENLAGTTIVWDDMEGNRHDVKWYTYEWGIEKKNRLELDILSEGATVLIERQKRRIKGLETVFIPELKIENIELNKEVQRLKSEQYTVLEALAFLIYAIGSGRFKK